MSSSASTFISGVIASAALFQLSSTGATDFVLKGFLSFDINTQIAISLFVVSLSSLLVSTICRLSPTSNNSSCRESVEPTSPTGPTTVESSTSTDPPPTTVDPVDTVIAAPSTESADKVTPSSLPSPPVSSPSKVPIDYPLIEIEKCEDDKARFMCMYPMIRKELLAHMAKNEMPQEALDWCENMMDYNVPGGKLNRGLTVVAVQRTLILAKYDRDLTTEEVARACVLGWALEFLQAFFLVADDLMDESKTRRGQPCWYKLPKVGTIAVNDSFLLESYVFTMLRTHFGSEPYYFQLVELYIQVIQQTEFGQLLDLTSQEMHTAKKKIDLDRFTLERYKLIVKYKTAFYSFYLPVALGMIISGVKEDEAYDFAQSVCCTMGEYFQIQDDVLDCYGDPATIGKIGTDIQDSKCSWLVVQALLRVNPSQKKTLEENYGQWDDKKVARVKALYKDLKLKELFDKYEEESYNTIQAQLDESSLVPREVFELFLKKIYKRSL